MEPGLTTLAFRLLFPGEIYYLVAAAAGVTGNNWPVYFRFKGGSGISAIYGGLFAIDPLAGPLTALAGFFIGMLLLRNMVLTFLLPLLFLIPWMWLRFHDPAHPVYAVFVVAAYMATLVIDHWDALRPGRTQVQMIDEKVVMMQMPMGRGMLRILDTLGLKKER